MLERRHVHVFADLDGTVNPASPRHQGSVDTHILLDGFLAGDHGLHELISHLRRLFIHKVAKRRLPEPTARRGAGLSLRLGPIAVSILRGAGRRRRAELGDGGNMLGDGMMERWALSRSVAWTLHFACAGAAREFDRGHDGASDGDRTTTGSGRSLGSAVGDRGRSEVQREDVGQSGRKRVPLRTDGVGEGWRSCSCQGIASPDTLQKRQSARGRQPRLVHEDHTGRLSALPPWPPLPSILSTSLDMLDAFEIITTSGVVLWSKSYVPISSSVINSLIRDVFIEEKIPHITAAGEDISAARNPAYKKDAYTLKWTTAKDLGLVFVVCAVACRPRARPS